MNVIAMDCRGLEFVEFKADVSSFKTYNPCAATHCVQGEWKVVGTETGTKFSGIDLTEGEWFDYDEKAGEEVRITNIRWEIRRA